jgi:hypothetical protein
MAACGVYWPLDGFAFEQLCSLWVFYLHAVERARSALAREQQAWVEIRDELHHQARKIAAGFLVIPEERIPLAPLDADGVDVELRALFTPGVPIRPVRTPPRWPQAAPSTEGA